MDAFDAVDDAFDAIDDLLGRLARHVADGSLSADEEAAALAVIMKLIGGVFELLDRVGE